MGGLCQNPLSKGSLFSIGLTYLHIKDKAHGKPGQGPGAVDIKQQGFGLSINMQNTADPAGTSATTP
jgi:hypothetical protein